MTLQLDNEMIELVVQGIDSNERDLQYHLLNLERYTNIVNDEDFALLDPNTQQKYQGMIVELNDRIREISLINKYANQQVTKEQKAEAKVRLSEKETLLNTSK